MSTWLVLVERPQSSTTAVSRPPRRKRVEVEWVHECETAYDAAECLLNDGTIQHGDVLLVLPGDEVSYFRRESKPILVETAKAKA